MEPVEKVDAGSVLPRNWNFNAVKFNWKSFT